MALQDDKKKKSLLDYFGMKSRDADDVVAALQDSLSVDRSKRVNAGKIESVLMNYLVEEANDREKRNRADTRMAGRKDERYSKTGIYGYFPGKKDPRFTEANPDTLNQRFMSEEEDYNEIVQKLLGREKLYPGQPMNAPRNEDLFRQYIENADEPTKKIIQMLLDDFEGNKKFRGLKLDN